MDTINVILDNDICMPVRGHDTDAGLDLKTACEVTIPAGKGVAIHTNVHFEIPAGYYGKLESKSGLNINDNIVCLGGTIDAGYTGEVIAKLYNLGEEDFTFEAGQKCVQIIFMPCLTPTINLVGEFEKTERGNNGFGSTGK